MCIEYHKDPSYHNNFIIKGFIETSFVDWPGSICSVLFLPNCNFRCSYCHNADLVLHPETMENVSLNSVV
ncbi:MAG: anaerobic ribonucleoside-triphosphate reductase activating protein, partial [Proteobacteria bacterium]|nr:anaerobic ribonucleoside-triphosphate reductase activating protein [Pseudomonadota bacterium]